MPKSKVIKRFLLAILFIVIALVIFNWELVSYGYRQAKGQLTIVWDARPIDTFLKDPSFPDSLKSKLKFIEVVRQYAIDSLGLNDTDNYKTMFDQKGEEVMWVVTASKPFALEAKEWIFPVLGAVPYKGYFDKERARKEKEILEHEGWDVSVRNPGGWSTLGWFTDPILSMMLERNEGDLASLIIHEMAHATIFVKDSIDFNENLASFIGDRGAEKFLIDTYGDSSEYYLTYLHEDSDYRKYVEHFLRSCDYLDSVYKAIEPLAITTKEQIKKQSIQAIVDNLDTLSLYSKDYSNRFQNRLPNNAYFLSFRRYQSKQGVFWDQWQHDFNGDLRAYIQWLSKRFPFL